MTRAYFILGYLDEDEVSYRDAVRLARDLDPDWVSFSITTPLPETELYRQALQRGLISEDCWSDDTLGGIQWETCPHIVAAD